VPFSSGHELLRDWYFDAVNTVISNFEFESGCSQPHLSLAFGFADDLGGKTKTRRKMGVAFHLKNDIVDDIVHGGGWRKKLRE
jgi:hypothetical protein